MLFDLTPKPIDPLTAPFVFGHDDRCVHPLPLGSIVADLAEGRGGWWWSARHTFPDPALPEEIEWADKSEAGRADTKAEALAACVGWMRGRL